MCISCFVVLCSDLACQAFGLMFGIEKMVLAGNGLGFGVAFLACKLILQKLQTKEKN